MPRYLIGSFVVLMISASVGAEEPTQQEDESESWQERIGFGGDFRLRYEGFRQDGRFDDGRRDRLRYRFRAGLDVEINDFLRVGTEVRSGNPQNPVSDNQTLTGAFDKDQISIAQAYADIRVSDELSVVAGKFSHRDLWSVSDMHWDSDVVLEGALESLSFDDAGGIDELGISVYQLPLDESGGRGGAWLLGFQVRPELKLTERSSLTLGVGFDYFVEPQLVVQRSLEGELAGNDVTNLLDDNGNLVSDFRILNLLAEWEWRFSEHWPIEISIYGYRNTGTSDRIGTETGITGARAVASDEATAFFGRAVLGSSSRPGGLQVRYTHYYSQPDALFYAFMQSDTNRASNVKGSRIDVRVGAPARTFLDFTWYRTRPEIGDDTTLNRWQLDYVFRF